MPAYSGPVVDVDVHHTCKTEAEVAKYLPAEWREFARHETNRAGMRSPLRPATRGAGALLGNGARRRDTFPADGSPPGSDYETMRAQLLDRYGLHHALLTHERGNQGTILNPGFAVAACQAFNDWTIDKWLTADPRFASAVVIPNAHPELAAKEIRRVGSHDQMVGVLVVGNPLMRPLGDPIYEPIFEAAAAMGLNILCHPAGGSDRSTYTAGGVPSLGLQSPLQLYQEAAHYLSSMITNGVFEKYPSISVQLTEYGITWLPALLWRLDQRYDLMRRESKWLKRWPSEYVTGHIRLSTQPMNEGPGRDTLVQLLETVDGIEDMLCFSTDYPHITADDPTYTARLLPDAWLQKVFCENACKLWGWPVPSAAPSMAQSTEKLA
jgi:predicted TIM-barrel fold metal-dependent hydrolase